MNYVRSCLIITMLLGVGYSDECEDFTWFNCKCNIDTWQEYYNSEGHNMEGCWLPEANLNYAVFHGASGRAPFFAGATLVGTDFNGADLTYAYFDETGECTGNQNLSCDGYDDASYDAGAESVDPGDMNDDGANNVQDVVLLVNDILNP